MTSTLVTATTAARTALLSAAIALGTAAAAQASTFTWDFSGTVGNPTGMTDPIVRSGQGTSTLAWGTSTTGGTSTGAASSSLSIIASSGDVVVASGTQEYVQFGSISWTNMSVFNAGGVWDTLLSFSGSFGHQGFGSVPGLASLSINVDNTEDPSTTPGNNNQTGDDPDIITFLTLDLGGLSGTPIDLGGGMSLLGFSVQLLNAGQCGTANAGTTGSTLVGDVWENCEGNTSVIGLFAKVGYDAPPAPIPLPAAGFLLLGGLGALAAVRRRRKAA